MNRTFNAMIYQASPTYNPDWKSFIPLHEKYRNGQPLTHALPACKSSTSRLRLPAKNAPLYSLCIVTMATTTPGEQRITVNYCDGIYLLPGKIPEQLLYRICAKEHTNETSL